MACQADGVTPMDVIGEVHFSLTRGQWTFYLDALVVRQLDIDILAGNPFMTCKDIGVCPAKRQIEIGGTEIISYSSPSRHTRQRAAYTILPATQPKPHSRSAREVCPVQYPFRRGLRHPVGPGAPAGLPF